MTKGFELPDPKRSTDAIPISAPWWIAPGMGLLAAAKPKLAARNAVESETLPVLLLVEVAACGILAVGLNGF